MLNIFLWASFSFIYLLWWSICSNICPFLMVFFILFFWVVCFLMYVDYKYFIKYIFCNYFLPISGLLFHFFISVFWMAKFCFVFDVLHFINVFSFLYCLINLCVARAHKDFSYIFFWNDFWVAIAPSISFSFSLLTPFTVTLETNFLQQLSTLNISCLASEGMLVIMMANLILLLP